MPQMKQALNLKLGAIYVLKGTYEKVRLLTVLPCEGVWVENAQGEGYGKTVPFEHLLYANDEEVKNFLDDYSAYHTADGYKPERQIDMNGDVYVREDEDYLCRD